MARNDQVDSGRKGGAVNNGQGQKQPMMPRPNMGDMSHNDNGRQGAAAVAGPPDSED